MERSSRFPQSVAGAWLLPVSLLFWPPGLPIQYFAMVHFGDTHYLWEYKTRENGFWFVGPCCLVRNYSFCFFWFFWLVEMGVKFVFDKTMRRTVFNFSVPLLAGGILCLALVMSGHYGLTSSMMLIFYGLALINCHHFSHPVLGTLGYLELLLGLVDSFVVTHALLLWTIGFGLLHVIFGVYLIVVNRKS